MFYILLSFDIYICCVCTFISLLLYSFLHSSFFHHIHCLSCCIPFYILLSSNIYLLLYVHIQPFHIFCRYWLYACVYMSMCIYILISCMSVILCSKEQEISITSDYADSVPRMNPLITVPRTKSLNAATNTPRMNPLNAATNIPRMNHI